MKAKKVLVTGGGRGIGAAVCRRLAEEGFRVIVHYNSSREKAEALAEELSAETGLPHAAVRADLRREEEIEALFRQAGDVDVLVNNAGVARQCLFTDMSASEWDELFSVDVRAAFLCAKQVMPHMLHEKAGSIIFISSMWGQVGASCEVAYSAAKAALIGMTKALAKELGPSGIRVNCIAPGAIETPINAEKFEDPEARAQTERMIPLHRIGTVEQVAAAAVWLASDESSYVTGTSLFVDGGMALYPSFERGDG